MKDLIEIAKNQIKHALIEAKGRAAEKNLLPDTDMPEFHVDVTDTREHGVFASNVAMVSAKAFRLPPRKIAEILISEVKCDGSYIAEIQVAGPGFINFFLTDGWYADVLKEIEKEGSSYGRTAFGQNKKVLVEYVSANPTGPMHIGNARGGAIGDCLAAVLETAGYEVSKEFYVNNAGNQIERFGLSLEARYLSIYCDDAEMPDDGYHGEDITRHAKAFAEKYGDAYVNTDAQTRREALVAYALPKNIDTLREDLAQYRIDYDTWFLESTLHQNGELDETIALLKKSGYTYEKDGALWYQASRFGGEKDEVLIRTNGIPTYFAADIAYHRNKFAVRGFDLCVNVWGADHHGHVARLKGALDAIGLCGSNLTIVLMQMVRLMRNGETVRVSKRTGKSITLHDLLEEIPVDAARFFFNLRQPGSHFDFDLGLAVEESAQNPVFYVQYAHARICSILKNLSVLGILPDERGSVNRNLLTEPEERDLIVQMAAFPGEVISAAVTLDPSKMTRYVLDLAAMFHKFYTACQVKNGRQELMQARMALCIGVRQVIANVLSMLKIEAPDQM